MQINKQK